MKKTKKLLLLLAVVITAIVCFALSASALDATGQCGDNVYWEYNSTTGELVISGTGAMTDYETSDSSPFYNSDIKKVIIGDGVTTIGEWVFYFCESLTEVNISDSVTTIGKGAFSSCESLTEVTIPDSVTTIGEGAFECCYSLAEVTIPDGVTTIGDSAFYNCGSLTKAIIPDSVTTIGASAFSYCVSLTEVTIPDSVTTIGNSAFRYCHSFTEVTIPDSVTTIGNYAFSDCYSLTEVTIGDSVTTIGMGAFYGCYSLTEVTIPDSVTIIGNYAFYDCGLTEVTIGNSVTTIGAYAFDDCYSLTDVYYGGTQEQWKKINIGSYNNALTGANIHYAGCYHLDENADKFCDVCKKYTEELYQSGPFGENVTYEWYADGVVFINGTGPMTDFPSYNSSPFYRAEVNSVVIGEGVTTIGSFAFYECKMLKRATIPDSVTLISDYAFANCDGLTSAPMGKNVTRIGEGAFSECDNIVELSIGDKVTSIGELAFLFCRKLPSVTIPENVISIEDGAFENCEKITNVTINGRLETIVDNTFYNCDSLECITLPDSITEIGERAFIYCTSLKDVYFGGTEDQWNEITIHAYNEDLTNATIHFAAHSHTDTDSDKFCDDCGKYTEKLYKSGSCGDNVTYEWYEDGTVFISGTGPMRDYEAHDSSPFYNSDIKKVIIGDGVTTIGDWAFCRCESLTEVTIPDSVTTIGDMTFQECDLTSVIIPDSVKTIGKQAFYSCDSLTSITIGKSVTTIGDLAFYWCDSLTEVAIGNSVTTIGDHAFSCCKSFTEVTIGDSVTTIGASAFSSCDSLTDITVDENNQYFSNDEYGVLFNKDKTTLIQYPIGNKRTAYTIPDSVTTIGDYAFQSCDSLTEVTIGDSVTTIGMGAFYGCYSLTEVTIPDSVTIIGNYAFYDCGSLTEVTIGNSVTTIGAYAFEYCYSLTDVYYGGTKEQWKKISIGLVNSDLTDANIHYNYCPHTDKTSYPQQNPTCTEIGYTAGVYCNICQRWSDGHEKINAKGHSYTEKIIDSAHLKSKATVASPAIYKYDCAVCDAISPDKTFTYGKALNLGTTSSVTATQTTSSLTLTWSKAANATGYRIYYKLPGDMSWRTSVSYTTATTVTYSNLPAGQSYRFAIRSAYKKADGTYILGGYKQIATATKAVAPANVDSLQNASSIRLNWTACPGATGYRIYYKSGNAWKICVSTTAATAHTFSGLKSGAKYTFAVRPYILVEGVVIWSNYITITTATQTISPVVTATSTSSGRIDLSWKAVNGAEAYQVYYKVGNGNYKLYKTYTTVQSLKFANLKSGTKYTFAVRGVIKGSEENIYGFHNPVTVTVR